MSTTQILIIVVAAIVVVGLLWYYRARIPGLRRTDPDVEREHQAAAHAAEDARVEAMVRRYCPHCGLDRDVRAGVCSECGYRFD